MSDLRGFLALLKKEYPEEIVVIQETVEPDYEITALIRKFEKKMNPV